MYTTLVQESCKPVSEFAGSSNTAVWIETDGAKLRLIKGLGYVEADGQGHYRK